jgi:GDP-mannose 6-dehydrogenase
MGYVGTVTAACLAAAGHEVWGVDVDETKVAMVVNGQSPVIEPGLEALVRDGRASGRLRATTSARKAVAEAEISLLCVGTPSSSTGGTNLDHVYKVVADLADALQERPLSGDASHVVVMRSTVPPGTVDDIATTLRALRPGREHLVNVAMCPEFLREGTGIADFYSPPFTVIGSADPVAIEVVSRLFSFIDSPLKVVEVSTAEGLKYACNAFHATKVSFANELGRLFRRCGVDSRKVMTLFCEDDQLNISTRYLRPGFAFGGSCLPKDLRSLLHLARMESMDLPMLAGVMATNRLSVEEVVDRVLEEEGRSVALLGLSFKSDSDDLRESPYVELAETLLGKGYGIRIYDPVVNPARLIGANRTHVESRLPHLRSILVDTAEEALRAADVAIVSNPAGEVINALLACPPPRIIDLDGRLGAGVEALSGYQGVAW